MNVYWSLVIFLVVSYIINRSSLYKKYECCICLDRKYMYTYLSYCKHPEIICYDCFFKIKENDDIHNSRSCPLCRNDLYVINVKKMKFTKLEMILITILRLQIIFIINQKNTYDIGILMIFFVEFAICDRYNIIQSIHELKKYINYTIIVLIWIEIFKLLPDIIKQIILLSNSVIQSLLILNFVFPNNRYHKYIY